MITVTTLLLDIISVAILVCAIKGNPPTKDKVRWIVACLILACTATVEIILDVDSMPDGFWSNILTIVNEIIPIIIIYSISELKIKRFTLIYVISYIINQLALTLVLTLMGNGEKKTMIIGAVITAVLEFVFAYLVVSVFGIKVDFVEIPNRILISIGAMFVAVIVFATGLYIYTLLNENAEFADYLGPLAVFVIMTVFAVAVETIYLAIKRRNLQEENTLLIQYNEQQQQYYELLLKKEEDTRRYRHDMLNHMICLDELLNEKDIDEAKKYINNITNDLNATRSNLYHSGNRIADVMMTSVLQNKSEDTRVVVLGQLAPELGISDHDLCIVISNILKNAVEAVNKQKTGEKYIKIKYSLGKRFIRIEEWNSIDESQVSNAQHLETSKEDKRHHGLGTKNVRLVAEKYNGKFTTEVKDNEFHICVDIDTKPSKKEVKKSI